MKCISYFPWLQKPRPPSLSAAEVTAEAFRESYLRVFHPASSFASAETDVAALPKGVGYVSAVYPVLLQSEIQQRVQPDVKTKQTKHLPAPLQTR